MPDYALDPFSNEPTRDELSTSAAMGRSNFRTSVIQLDRPGDPSVFDDKTPAVGLNRTPHPDPRMSVSNAAGELRVGMLVPAPNGSNEPMRTLIASASLYTLANSLNGAAQRIWDTQEDWGDLGPALAAWIDGASGAIAHAIHFSAAVIDVDNAVIDGAIPSGVRAQLAKRVREHLSRLQSRRIEPFTVSRCTFPESGSDAMLAMIEPLTVSAFTVPFVVDTAISPFTVEAFTLPLTFCAAIFPFTVSTSTITPAGTCNV